MSLALWLLIYLLVTYAIGKLYEVVAGWKTVGLVFYPAMLVAAGGRLLACAIGQQKSGKADVMRSSGPTDHEPPAGGAVFRFLFSILPFALSLVVFILAWKLLDEPVGTGRLPMLEADPTAVGDSAQALGEQFNAFWSSILDQQIGNVKFWLFLYVGFSLIVAPAPGKSDLVGIAALCVVLGAGTWLLTQAGVEVVAKGVYKGAAWKGFSLLVGMSVFVLAASALVLLPAKLLRSKEG